jgi:hypothetical protein
MANNTHAVKKFIATHATIIINFFQSLAFMKQSGSLLTFSSVPSSPFKTTKPPNGIQFKVYSVPCLSFRRVLILGGIHNQNSFT